MLGFFHVGEEGREVHDAGRISVAEFDSPACTIGGQRVFLAMDCQSSVALEREFGVNPLEEWLDTRVPLAACQPVVIVPVRVCSALADKQPVAPDRQHASPFVYAGQGMRETGVLDQSLT